MTRRAVLAKCQVRSLFATKNDLDAMTAALELFGFECRTLSGPRATRSSILSAYETLIRETASHDAALFYFSGHGGHALNPDYCSFGIPRTPRHYRFIVPTDIDQSTAQDFRGITNHELSFMLDRLLERTMNATLVLDCCHSALMSRGIPGAASKALPEPRRVSIQQHIQQLSKRGIDTSSEGRRDTRAVGVVACGMKEQAFEYEASPGWRISVLTQSLATALAQVGSAKNVDWRGLVASVRELVQGVVPGQHPLVEGAALRLLFSLREADVNGALTVVMDQSQPRLSGGRLVGVRRGDCYSILPPGADPGSRSSRIATATVTEVQIATASVELSFCDPHVAVPSLASAYPVSAGSPTLSVYIDPTAHESGRLARCVHSCSHLGLVDDALGPWAQVRLTADRSSIRAHDGNALLLFHPNPNTDDGLEATVGGLRAHAKARALLRLESGEGRHALEPSIETTWGKVEDGVESVLERCGATASVGECIFVRVTNPAFDQFGYRSSTLASRLSARS